MIQARTSLVKNPANAALLVEVFARVVEAKLAMKVSPSLSAANNTAIMLAAVLYENLSGEKAHGWHEEFEKHLKSICKWWRRFFSDSSCGFVCVGADGAKRLVRLFVFARAPRAMSDDLHQQEHRRKKKRKENSCLSKALLVL
jgi:hypothetical protein